MGRKTFQYTDQTFHRSELFLLFLFFFFHDNLSEKGIFYYFLQKALDSISFFGYTDLYN